MRDLLVSAKQELLWFLDGYPRIFSLQMALRRSRRLAVGPQSHLCIEGFPRSGNTYAVAAFQEAQTEPIEVARHLHSPSHVRTALSLGVPTILVLRAPPDPILSLVLRNPALSVPQVLRHYLRFHEQLLPFRSELVVAPFEIVLGDFGSVIREVNRRFDTAFEVLEDAPESETAVLERIEAMEREDNPQGAIRENAVARPSEERRQAKLALLPTWEDPALANQRQRASDLYASFRACWTENSGHG